MGFADAGIDDLLSAARAGESNALGQLLEACRGYLLAIADREFDSRLGPKAGASDLVQETFLKAQREIAGFRGGSQAELLAWLRQLLLNNLANFARGFHASDKRRLSREQPLADTNRLPATDLSPSGQAMRSEETDILQQALARLSDSDRLLIQLRYREELSFNQIAERLGCSARIVRRMWADVVVRLRCELDAMQ